MTFPKQGGIYLGRNLLSEQEFINLYNECLLLKNTTLWKVFQETLKDEAQQVMYTRSKDYMDMIVGKMMLYNLDVQEKIVERIELGMQKHQALKKLRK